ITVLDSNPFFLDSHFAPLTVVSVLPRIRRIEFFFVYVRGVGSAGSHRYRAISAVTEARERNAEDRNSRNVVIAGVNSDLIKPEFAVPAQVRINHGDRNFHRGASRRNQHFVRASVSRRIGLNSAALQVDTGLAQRPAPDDVSSERDHIPRVNLLSP